MKGLGRRTAGLLWRGRAVLTVAALATALVALGLNVYRDHAVQPLILRAMDTAPRIAAELALAQARLHAVALDTQAGGPPAELRRRYEGFVAMIERLRAPATRALFADLPRFQQTLEWLEAFQARIDDRLGRSVDQPAAFATDMPPAAVEEMLGLLPLLAGPVEELLAAATAAQRLELVRLTRIVRVADRLQLLAAGLAVGLMLLLAAALCFGRAAAGSAAAPAASPRDAAATRPLGPGLLAALARDLAAPLHRIVGTLGVMLAQPDPQAVPPATLRAARDAAEDLLAITDALRDAAALVERRSAPEQVPFGAEAVLARAAAALSDRIAAMGGRVVVAPETGMAGWWAGDGERLVRLLHLLALRCLPIRPGGALLLRLTDGGGGLVAEVGDPASPALPADAFEPVELEGNWPGEGLGEGLAAAAVYATALGGRLMRLRAGGGRGETVRCLLPFAPAAAPAPPPPSADGRLRLLAVDDVPTNRRLLATILEQHGHVCDVATDAREALRLLRQTRYDAVLMDVQMPGIDGAEATRLIRALPPPAGTVPVIAVTAHVLPEQRAAFLAAGMAAVVEKPVTASALMAALARVVPAAGRWPEPMRADAVPLLDQQTLALVRSTLAPADFARLVERQVAAGAAALARAEAAAERGDSRALEEALADLVGAYEGLGASRVAAAAQAVQEERAGLEDLRRTVEATASQLRRRAEPALR